MEKLDFNKIAKEYDKKRNKHYFMHIKKALLKKLTKIKKY